ncbi:dihydrofolate reductase [Alkaliphilus transvaalensis]|uniref:dihydrofolate reductase n=1 Tax=Alkaliphilus transvaalensis TaxID=114628 RepID=UPI00047B88F9|nr:dihydrofolate reductase [Alkaliphilus transvaalensis]
MLISMIVAMGKNGVIGKDNGMPWSLPSDLQYFKSTTMDHPIIMGRRCYESIGRPLPGRKNVVLSRSVKIIEGCEVLPSMNDVFETFKNEDEVFIIGGGQIYKTFLPYAKKLYITLIDEVFEGDTVFPKIDFNEWRLLSKKEGIVDSDNPHNHTFYVYEREERV